MNSEGDHEDDGGRAGNGRPAEGRQRTAGRPRAIPAGGIGTVVASIRSVAGRRSRRDLRRSVPVGRRRRHLDRLAALGRPERRRRRSAQTTLLRRVRVAARARRPRACGASVDDSGARTTTCLTASWPRSIDWATNAVPMVAAADPMATPTMVPLTPKIDAMIAAITAPAAEARIWRMENFTPRPEVRPPPASALRSLPHGAVDLLAQQVGVPVVARVLLDHVDHDPAQGRRAASRPTPRARRGSRRRRRWPARRRTGAGTARCPPSPAPARGR